MLKAFKYRIYPSKNQSVLIDKHFGCCRLVYNLALETRNDAYKSNEIYLSYYDLKKQLPALKKEFTWLKEINSQSLQNSLFNMDSAFRNFFQGRAKFPNFKKKSSKQSFNVPQKVRIENNLLYIPKFKEGISINLHRSLKGTIKQATISKTPTGKYFASILCETYKEKEIKFNINSNKTIGIDVGIKSFLVSSNGLIIDNPSFLRKSLKKLKYAQKKFSKNKSKRRKLKVAKIHEKVAAQRKDFLQKLSSKIISDNQTIVIEDLNVKGMIKNHNLALSIADVGWSSFIRMLQYKADWYGNNIIQINRFEPTSKTCHVCKTINKDLTLKDRNWICKNCKTQHDRDLNAAINIKKAGLILAKVSGIDT